MSFSDAFAAERQRGQEEHRFTGAALCGFLVQRDGLFQIGLDFGSGLEHGGKADHRRNIAPLGTLPKCLLRLQRPLLRARFIGDIRPAEFETARQKNHAGRVASIGGGAEMPHRRPSAARNRFALQR